MVGYDCVGQDRRDWIGYSRTGLDKMSGCCDRYTDCTDLYILLSDKESCAASVDFMHPHMKKKRREIK